jgi:pimeloyl-ACP methyl ester carboxylesterase
MTTRLILVPGTLCDQRLFAALARRLRPAVSVQVARWRDLLGVREPSWWRQAAPFSLLGFSLGGIWALQRLQAGLADRTPPPVERLALVGSNADGAGRQHRRRRQEQQRLLQRRGTAGLAKAAKGHYFAGRPTRWQARLVLDMARRTPASTARKQMRLAAQRSDTLEALAAFPGPVAVLSGLHDRLCTPGQQQRMQAARCDALAQAWVRCGHMIPLEAPGRLALAIQRWLAQTPRPQPIAIGVSTR